METAKDSLDPLAIGTLHAGIETSCRGLRDKAAAAQQQNISILMDAQKAKLNALDEASTLGPTISQATSANLLQSAGPPPIAFSANSSFNGLAATLSGTVPGCSVGLSSLFPGNIIPSNRIDSVPRALPQLRQFFALSDDQEQAIIQTNTDYNAFSIQEQQQIQNAQSQIAVETARDSLDPLAIGTLYAGIETACRELNDRAMTSQRQNVSILTDGQKAKLNVLKDAVKLAPVISAAESGNLFGEIGSPPSSFDDGFRLSGFVVSLLLSRVPGCGFAFRGIFISGSSPASR